MVSIQELVSVGGKTTMRIGGKARYYAELATKEDIEAAVKFSTEKHIPLIVLGGGSNTVFADGVIDALVVRLKHDAVQAEGNKLIVGAGKILASLLMELAERDLDLSLLTGIPGTVGGAIFGNAGQGHGGVWIGSFVESVTAYVDEQWQTFSKEECAFAYRESVFKKWSGPPIIWEVTLRVPSKPKAEVLAEIDHLIKKRIETQPHVKTAGSCFKSLPDGTPAWKLIDKAGLRGTKVGDVEIAEKHANFLLNTGKATFDDAKKIVELVRRKVPEKLEVEMRFIEEDGTTAF